MEITPVSSLTFTTYDAVAKIKQAPFIPQHLKVAIDKVVIPPDYVVNQNITRAYAIQLVMSQLAKDLKTYESHPRTIIEKAVATFPTRITPAEVVCNDTKMCVRNAYVVPEDSDTSGQLALKAHVSDIVAYSYTPNSPDYEGALMPNFKEAKEVVFPKVGHAKVSITNWTMSAVKNSDELFKTLTSAQKLLTQSEALTKEIFNQKGMEKSFMPYSIPKKATIGYMKEGARYTNVPSRFIPPDLNADNKTLEYAYQFLTISRRHRGADKDHVSALTSGYYWMSCSRAVNSLFSDTLDLLHIMYKSDARVIVHDGLSPHVAASLAVNGMVAIKLVNTLTTSLDGPKLEKDGSRYVIVPGVYEIKNVSVLNGVRYIRYYKVGSEVQPTVSKKGQVVYSPDTFYEKLEKVVATSKEMMVFVIYASPRIFNYNKMFVYPSVRAHSGQVVVTNFEVNQAVITPAKQAHRMVSANMVKTWFPYARYPFFIRDKSLFGIQFEPYMTDTGVILQNFAMTNKKKQITFDVLPPEVDTHYKSPYLEDWGVTEFMKPTAPVKVAAPEELVTAYADDEDEEAEGGEDDLEEEAGGDDNGEEEEEANWDESFNMDLSGNKLI